MALNERDFGVLKSLVHKRLILFWVSAECALVGGVAMLAVMYGILRYLVWAISRRMESNLSGGENVLALLLLALLFGLYFLLPKGRRLRPGEEVPEPEFGRGVRGFLGTGNGQSGLGCLMICLFGVRLIDISLTQFLNALKLQLTPIATIEAAIEPLLRRDSITVEELAGRVPMKEEALKKLLVLLDAVIWLHASRKLAAALSSAWSDPLLGVDEEE